MIRHAHHRNNSKGNVKKDALDFMAAADKDGDGRIGREEFFLFYKEHWSLLILLLSWLSSFSKVQLFSVVGWVPVSSSPVILK